MKNGYNKTELYPNTTCLSSSQILDYEKSPRDFYMRWVMDGGDEANQAMNFGSLVSMGFAGIPYPAGAIAELRPRRLQTLLHEVVAALPKIPAEFCEQPFRVKHRGWKIRITPDACIPAQFEIIENKTGQTLWDQERVNYSDQITLQAWGFWKTHGVPPRRIRLNWANTSPNSKRLIVSFTTTRSVKRLREIESRIDAVIDGITAGHFGAPIYS